MIPSRHSFKLLSRAEIKKIRLVSRLKNKNLAVLEFKQDSQKLEELEAGDKKRMFLKLAGLVGLGAAASLLFPKKAEALVFGSTPASNVVGVKNIANARIDPAQETGGNLATIAGKDFATQTTLALIKAQTDKFKFTGDDLQTVGGSAASAVKLKDVSDTIINPSTEDSVVLLRRIARQIDSLAVVDSQQRQRVVAEQATTANLQATVTLVNATQTIGTVTTVSTITNAVPVGNVATLAGVDVRFLYIDTARNAYANGMRSNLINA